MLECIIPHSGRGSRPVLRARGFVDTSSMPKSHRNSPRGIALPVLMLVLLPWLAACAQKDAQPKAGTAGTAAANPSAAPPAVPVHVVVASAQNVPIAFEAVGQTEGSKQVEVRARVSGILQQRLYSEGAWVRAGTPLFQIDRAPFELALMQARAQLAQDQARAAQARREADRLKPLAEERAISRKDYDDAVSAMQMTQAAGEQSRARVQEAELNLSYTRVIAPVSGMTGRAERSEGSLITVDANGSLLTTLNQIDPIWVRFSLSESDLAKLPTGRVGNAPTSDVALMLADGTRYPVNGRINFTATQIDPKLGTQQLRAEFANPGAKLLPGQFVRVRIVAGQQQNVVLVPQSAVMQTEKGHFVFVDDAGKAALRPVETGEWSGANWIIRSGIAPGDRVVVDNLMKLKPGSPIAIAPPQPPANAAAGGTPAVANAAPSAAPAPGPAAKR